MPSTAPCELQLDQACQRLHLARGAVICCLQGRLWLTQDTARQRGPSPDLVLHAGQRHTVAEDGDYFLTHLQPDSPARCSVAGPGGAPARARRWAFSPR